MDGEGNEATYVLQGRESLTPVFADLNRYEATMHFNGQSTVTLEGDRATGESYTIAHHVFTEEGLRKMMVAWLRYLDVFVKIDGSWYFAERKLILDWSEYERSPHPRRHEHLRGRLTTRLRQRARPTPRTPRRAARCCRPRSGWRRAPPRPLASAAAARRFRR